MNKFINKIYIKALVGANMAKNELQKMREEDEGLDIIITIYIRKIAKNRLSFIVILSREM